MVRIIAGVLALILAGNGVMMLLAPLPWYDAVPGVVATGPFNPHFVRDIGAAYLVAGLGAAAGGVAGAGGGRRLPGDPRGDPRL